MLFVLATATTITAVFMAGLRIPDVKYGRVLSSSRRMMALAFFFLGAPVLVRYFFRSLPSAMLYIAFSFDTLAYYLLLLAVLQVMSGRNVWRNGRFLSCTIIAVLSSFASFLSYMGILGASPYLRVPVIALFVFSSACMAVIFPKMSKGAWRIPASKWFVAEFYSTLFMTLYSAVLLPLGITGGIFSDIILVLYTLLNILYVVFFANYINGLRAQRISPECKSREKDLKSRIEKWVAEEKYLSQDQGMEEVAAALGTDLEFLRYYFRTYMPSDFRTWRVSLRIEYAKRLMCDNPDISMNEIAGKAGFVSKSNFYHFFKKITGETPVEYKAGQYISSEERNIPRK